MCLQGKLWICLPRVLFDFFRGEITFLENRYFSVGGVGMW